MLVDYLQAKHFENAEETAAFHTSRFGSDSCEELLWTPINKLIHGKFQDQWQVQQFHAPW